MDGGKVGSAILEFAHADGGVEGEGELDGGAEIWMRAVSILKAACWCWYRQYWRRGGVRSGDIGIGRDDTGGCQVKNSETGSCLGMWTQQRKEGRGTGPMAWWSITKAGL
jgi:hypothetical protein